VEGTYNMVHTVLMMSRIERVSKLQWLFDCGKIAPGQRTIVFCNSKNNVDYVAAELTTRLRHFKLNVMTFHGGMSQPARDGVLKAFQSGVCSVVVATDVLSRGIDIHNVISVVHFEMPVSFDVWVHRCGRCARHGLRGYVFSFFLPENIRMAKPLVAYLRQHRQIVPAKLSEYSRESFIDLFTKSTFLHSTKSPRSSHTENHTYVNGLGTPRFPDFDQSRNNKHQRPL
jgi:superfamily II DNA/RNA helicase